jgi:hypothetical protein
MQFEFLHKFLNVFDVIIILSGIFSFYRILKLKPGTSSLLRMVEMIRGKSISCWPVL